MPTTNGYAVYWTALRAVRCIEGRNTPARACNAPGAWPTNKKEETMGKPSVAPVPDPQIVMDAHRVALLAQHVHALVIAIDGASQADHDVNEECAAALALLGPAATDLLMFADKLAEKIGGRRPVKAVA